MEVTPENFNIYNKIFSEKFYPIHPFGDEDTVVNAAVWVILRDTKDNQGVLLTPEILIEKYSDYVQSLQQYQNGKYTKKEHRITAPYEWLEQAMWNQRVISKSDPTDFYLFGI